MQSRDRRQRYDEDVEVAKDVEGAVGNANTVS